MRVFLCCITYDDIQPKTSITTGITSSANLKEEGLAREFVNRIQGLRKDAGFTVTDKITIWIEKNDLITAAIKNNFSYICKETLAKQLNYEEPVVSNSKKINLIDGISINVSIVKN